jgi:DivIVA domain-containing protein
VDLDRQSVERRDFPISRRGYDPAAVDAHLRALAAAVEELIEELDSRGEETLGSTAGTQVQSILEAAEATAAGIEREAAEQAAATRLAADQDAQRTRNEAVDRAQRHVQAVSEATAVLRERVESMDGEVSALVQSLRAGAGRLAADLGSVETNMGELYDAAAGAAVPAGSGVEAEVELETAPPASIVHAPGVLNGSSEHPPTPVPDPTPAPAHASAGDDDQDGARLIALNMALNGEPREQAERYLAENFDLADRETLLDEVYAAIEG